MKENLKQNLGRLILALAVAVACLIVLSLCLTKVPAGYVAVQYSVNGGVKDEVLYQGWHFVPPTIKTTKYSVGLEQSYLTVENKGDSNTDESFSVSSSEGKAMQIDLTFTYQYKPEDVVGVFTTFKGQDGKAVRDSFIKPNIISWSKEVIARYRVSDVLGEERANVNLALSEYLSEKFAEYGITISNVSLIDIRVDAETQEAINAKIMAQQDAETQAIKNQTAIDKAKADAEVARTTAQAQADAALIEAQAKAEANELLSNSLTDRVLRQMYIDKWDGKLPTVISDDNTMMLDLGELQGTDSSEGE